MGIYIYIFVFIWKKFVRSYRQVFHQQNFHSSFFHLLCCSKKKSAMDREQEEMQNLGVFGIYLEAYRVIFKQRKIFSQITLSLILPLSFIFLAHMEISHYFDFRISHAETQLHHTKSGTEKNQKISDFISSEFLIQCIFNVFYFSFLFIFSLLSTSAVVYTIACTYTGQEITFKKVMSVVLKVWKRLMVTFICTFIAFFVYNSIAFLALFIWFISLVDTFLIDAIILVIMLVIYMAGFIYMTVIWNLASVVSVLEDSYGIKAMMKSKELIKGKMLVTVVIFLKLNLSMAAIRILFDEYVVHGSRIMLGFLHRIGFGMICLLLLFKVILFGLVIQTIIYFVCKSYHHEKIDKSVLSDHLEVYLGEYVPLKSKDIQLENYDV